MLFFKWLVGDRLHYVDPYDGSPRLQQFKFSEAYQNISTFLNLFPNHDYE